MISNLTATAGSMLSIVNCYVGDRRPCVVHIVLQLFGDDCFTWPLDYCRPYNVSILAQSNFHKFCYGAIVRTVVL